MTKYTSKKLSQWLEENGYEWETNTRWKTHDGSSFVLSTDGVGFTLAEKHNPEINAYDICNDLLITHAKELFGEEKHVSTSNVACRDCEDDCYLPKYMRESKIIFSLLQQGEIDKAEEYIMTHAIKK